MRPLILVTNDDGIASPGLQAAADAVADLGELVVVAPATQQTSMSRAIVTGPDVGVIAEYDMTAGGRPVRAFSVVGSPVLAVTHALLELTDRLPDLCVSGVNYGENVGGGLGVSGTVAAALEAETRGVPGLAASVQLDVAGWRSFEALDWSAARHFTHLLAAQILSEGLPRDVAVLNLNVPRAATPATPLRRTVQSRLPYYVHRRPAGTRVRSDPLRLSVETVVHRHLVEPGSDVEAVVLDGVASVTPLSWSMTARTDWQPRTAAAPRTTGD